VNILMTGSTGFVGKHLSRELQKRGHEVHCIARHEGDDKVFIMDLAYSMKEDMLDNLKRLNIDVLIHMASEMASSTMDEEQETQLFYNNLKITENIILLIKTLRIRKLINFSSMSVYPNQDGFFGEASEIRMSGNQDCMYGLSKFCAENLYDYLLKDTVISNLRIAQIYGKGERKDRIREIYKQELQNRNEIEVWGEGERTSSFIHVNKLVDVVCLFVEHDYSGIFNVGEANISYLSIAEEIKEKYGDENTKIRLLHRGLRTKFALNIDKLKKIEEINNDR